MNPSNLNIFEQLQRRRLMLPSFDEIIAAFANMSVQEVSVAVGVVLWLALLCLPLSHIDRRDNTTAATYIFWIIVAGVTLIVGMPNALFKMMHSGDHLLLVVALACGGSLRWGLRRRLSPALADSQNTEKKA